MDKGYFEVNQMADLWRTPVTAFAGNVIYNGRHWHEHIEMILCILGQVRVTIEDEDYVLAPGDFVTINSEQSHITQAQEKGCLQVVCSIRKDALQAMDDHWIYCNSTQEDKSVCPEDREAIGHNLCALASSLVTGNLLFEERESLQNLSYQYQLLAILAKYKKKIDVKKSRHETLISGCVRYIHEHMAEELGAAVLADHFHVSQSTIYRLFYKEMGVHLNEYITTLRISAACRMLQNQKQSVTEIAFACGFSGLSNFYRVFKQKLGVSPKEYQRDHPIITTPCLLHQPDIMKLNQFQNFWETGYGVEVLEGF